MKYIHKIKAGKVSLLLSLRLWTMKDRGRGGGKDCTHFIDNLAAIGKQLSFTCPTFQINSNFGLPYL